jgi:cell surface protein SprA
MLMFLWHVTTFSINGVNLEENASKSPVNYVVPPDIPREIGVGVGRNIIQLNEQAMKMIHGGGA